MLKTVSEVTSKEDITLITLDVSSAGDAAAALEKLAGLDVNIDMISLSSAQGGSAKLSFTTSDADFGKVLSLGGAGNLRVSSGNVKFSFFGLGMKYTSGVAAEVITLFTAAGIDIKLITTSTCDISILIDACDASKAAELTEQYIKLTKLE